MASSTIAKQDIVASTEVDTVVAGNPDTLAEVPSAAWGWSGEAPRVRRIVGWLIVLALLTMLRGNHIGHVEDIFLIGFAAAIAALLIRDMLQSRKPR